MLNVDQSQRRDIDTTLDDRLTLVIDEENIADNPYIFEPTSFVGNNWFKQGSNIVKLNLVEQDSIVFVSAPLVKLLQKDITNVIVSFDYNISNVSVNYPILSNISLTCMEMTNYMLVENILTTQGHIDVDCSLFNFSNKVVNNAISEQGFKVGINFNGNKSNATIKLSNVQIQFKYNNKLLSQSDSVINRLEPYVDFWREDDDLVLQIGGDATGKGIDHNGGDVDWSDIENKPSDYPPSTHTHISSEVTDLINTIYPIGSIYMSVSDVSPSILFGGEWEQIEDRFLLAKGGNFNTLNGTGGSATVTLTKDQMPVHTHIQNAHSHTIGSLARYAVKGAAVAAVGDGYGNTQNYKTGNTTATNQNAGGGQAHENMPPYLIVNMWKRTA